MKLAYTMAPGRGDTDLILASLAATLAARGLICGGTVQINTERADSGPCDMDVKVLPDGPVLRISQELGRAAAGCRLNPDALETSVALASARLDAGADIIMINKFGKHEAEGRGSREVIAKALAMDIPVLVGTNARNLPALELFTGGDATMLRPEPAALLAWVDGVMGGPAAVT